MPCHRQLLHALFHCVQGSKFVGKLRLSHRIPDEKSNDDSKKNIFIYNLFLTYDFIEGSVNGNLNIHIFQLHRRTTLQASWSNLCINFCTNCLRRNVSELTIQLRKTNHELLVLLTVDRRDTLVDLLIGWLRAGAGSWLGSRSSQLFSRSQWLAKISSHSTKVPAITTFAKLKAKEPVTAPMSASEIQSWISSSTNEGEENGDQRVWQRDQVLNDWPRSLEYAQNFLLNGKTKSRILFLKDEILSLAKHGGFYSIPRNDCPSVSNDLPSIS